ncbi:OLC1v1022284C1 [Oldenlandia corymbosa var. corymbosa]|uniref:OLC1v1022284C1 n=1 Tax=Oldenlandia corymbosa var. corymbosa TaxID=529605 RepID=A0AAV1C188_OLDCO|nr:OLC1v1022284C1 [Oldenlandia corymbosa var. corymbosa]
MRSSSSPSQRRSAAVLSSRLTTLHERLYNSLKLGQFFRCDDSRGQKWASADIETQKVVIRSIDAFLDYVSSERMSNHQLVKDSINDMAGALESVLEFKNESVLRLASDLAAKMVRVLPSSLLEPHVTYLVDNLLPLLSSQQLSVSVSSATALNCIFANLSRKREKEIWEILEGRDSVNIVIENVKDSCIEDKFIEYYEEMTSLLSQILWRWPPSRFSAWNDSKLWDFLGDLLLKPISSLKAAVLHVYSSLALCGYGAKKLLSNGKIILEVMVDCMNISESYSIQMEGFRLAQCLMVSEQGCAEVMKLCGKPLVNAIVNGMRFKWLTSEKLSKDQMSLVLEACHMAQITRWIGNHHTYFWKARVDTALLDILLAHLGITRQSLHHASLKEQIGVLEGGRRDSVLSSLIPYVWDILAGLLVNMTEDLCRTMHELTLELNILITCACLAFMESNLVVCQISRSTISDTDGRESSSRAVLQMVYSPCKHIASQARIILSEVLKFFGKDNIDYLLGILRSTTHKNTHLLPSNFQVVISLITLACYTSLPTFEKRIIELHGMGTLLAFLKGWFNNPTYVKRSNLEPHLNHPLTERICCRQCIGDWDGEDMQLVFCLWGLAQLIHNSATRGDATGIKSELGESKIFKELEDVCSNNRYSPASRWYAAFTLSHFGLYGFPSKLGKRIWKTFKENELTDLEIIFANQCSLHAHEVILSARCPQLLHQREEHLISCSSVGQKSREVRLSSRVDYKSLHKLMEYVYSGYIQAGADVRTLKVLVKHCNLQPLLHLLNQKSPRWGSPVPTFDLSSALGLAGYNSS